jgi:hypothetical protein
LHKKTKAAVIGISGTWLGKSVKDSEMNIDNYTVIRYDRDRHVGGVCCYVRNDIAFTTRPDLNDFNDKSFLLIRLPKNQTNTCRYFI